MENFSYENSLNTLLMNKEIAAKIFLKNPVQIKNLSVKITKKSQITLTKSEIGIMESINNFVLY